jgi:hypothetical protein
MWSFTDTVSCLALLRICPSVAGLPAPQGGGYAGNIGPVGGVDAPLPTVTSAFGSLYGNSDLLGEVFPSAPVSGGDSAIVNDVELVPGQEADSKLGLYLDFNSAQAPQPIRGIGGQTDPGPSKYTSYFL